MTHIELWNGIIAAGTSIFVVILSQVLINRSEKKRIINDERNHLHKLYIGPIRFMLAENYYRIYEIFKQKERRKDLLSITEPIEILDKDEDWFVGEGCYLVSSCYLTGCLFAYMQNIRNGMPFIKFSYYNDTKSLELTNKLVVDFSRDLKIYYVIQMNIGKEFYVKNEDRVITYREFCTLLKRKENFNWYQSLIDYYLRIGKGEYEQLQTLLINIKELAGVFDKMVSGGDSIKQKMLVEGKNLK